MGGQYLVVFLCLVYLMTNGIQCPFTCIFIGKVFIQTLCLFLSYIIHIFIIEL